MKKHLLSLLAALFLMGTTATAQNLVFYYHGEPLENEAMIIIPAEENDFGELCCETNPSSNPNNGLVLDFMSGTFGGSVTYEATLYIEEHTFDAEVLQWCMGGSCDPMNNVQVLMKPVHSRPGTDLVSFDATNIRSIGHLRAWLRVRLGDEERIVKILFNNNDPTLGIITPQPSTLNTQHFYTLDGRKLSGKPATAGIYVVDGKKVVIK